MKLTCYKVLCREANGNIHTIGVMTTDTIAAMHCAENSLFEGQHISAKAISCEVTDKI